MFLLCQAAEPLRVVLHGLSLQFLMAQGLCAQEVQHHIATDRENRCEEGGGKGWVSAISKHYPQGHRFFNCIPHWPPDNRTGSALASLRLCPHSPSCPGQQLSWRPGQTCEQCGLKASCSLPSSPAPGLCMHTQPELSTQTAVPIVRHGVTPDCCRAEGQL